MSQEGKKDSQVISIRDHILKSAGIQEVSGQELEYNQKIEGIGALFAGMNLFVQDVGDLILKEGSKDEQEAWAEFIIYYNEARDKFDELWETK